MLFVLFWNIYLFKNLCIAKIVDDKLVLKKLLKSTTKTYTFDKIDNIDVLRTKSDTFVELTMKDENDTLNTYIIFPPFFPRKDSALTLRILKKSTNLD